MSYHLRITQHVENNIYEEKMSAEELSTVNKENLCYNNKVMISHCKSASQVLWQKLCLKKLQHWQFNAIVH